MPETEEEKKARLEKEAAEKAAAAAKGDSSDEVKALKLQLAELERQLADAKKPKTPDGEIPRASEESVHAVLESMKAVHARLDALDAKKRPARWAP